MLSSPRRVGFRRPAVSLRPDAIDQRQDAAGLTFVLYGAIIVLIARFQPGGILTLINRIWVPQSGKKSDGDAARGVVHAP